MSVHPQMPSLKPSVEARQLFNQMVVRAQTHGSSKMYISLQQTISLAIHRRKQGRDPECPGLIHELVAEGWIEGHEEGGWKITCSARR